MITYRFQHNFVKLKYVGFEHIGQKFKRVRICAPFPRKKQLRFAIAFFSSIRLTVRSVALV